MLARFAVSVAVPLALVACERSAAPPIAPEPPPMAIRDEQPASTTPPAGACDEPHVWDPVARACRLHPGGGNGWAGCSLAPAPPNGEQCITGTHWERSRCDCVCDGAGETWDARTRACSRP